MGHINRQVVVDLVEQRKFRKADFPVGPTLIQSAPFKGDRAGEDEWETPTSLGRMTRIRMEHEIDKQPSFRTRFLLWHSDNQEAKTRQSPSLIMGPSNSASTI